MVLGNRRFPQQAMPPHNDSDRYGCGHALGRWFGFNGGSALAANGDAGMMLVTHILRPLAHFLDGYGANSFGKASALGIVTGMVAGLGTITPASGYVGPGGALIIGLSAGVVCFFATIYRWAVVTR